MAAWLAALFKLQCRAKLSLNFFYPWNKFANWKPTKIYRVPWPALLSTPLHSPLPYSSAAALCSSGCSLNTLYSADFAPFTFMMATATEGRKLKTLHCQFAVAWLGLMNVQKEAWLHGFKTFEYVYKIVYTAIYIRMYVCILLTLINYQLMTQKNGRIFCILVLWSEKCFTTLARASN